MNRLDAVCFLQFQGVEQLLTERSLDGIPAPWDTLPALVSLTGGVDISPRQLDRSAFRVTGGGFTASATDDGSLSDLFRFRQSLVCSLLNGHAYDDSVTFLSVTDTSAFPSAGTLFIGSESFTYTSKTSSQFLGVTRAAFGSRAETASAGAPVWPFVRSLRGRRVTAYRWDKITNTVSSLSVGVVDKSPTVTLRNRWQFDARALDDDLAARQFAVGLKPAQFTDGTASAGTLAVVDSDSYLFPDGGGYVVKLVPKADERSPLLWYVDDATSGVMTLGDQLDAVLYGKDTTLWDTNTARDTAIRVQAAALLTQQNTLNSVQPVVWLTGDPVTVALTILLSKYGDGSGGVWDTLKGAPPTAGFSFDGFRLGAGLEADQVDVSAFLALRGVSPFHWTVYADAPASVGDMLTELCLVLGAFWSVDSSGRVTVQRLPLAIYDTDVASGVVSASQRVESSADQIELDEQGNASAVTFTAGVNLLDGSSDLSLTVQDVRVVSDDLNRLSFSLQFTDVDAGAVLPTPRIKRVAVSMSHLMVIAQRFMSPFAPPDLLISATVNTPVTVGDVVTYSHAGFTDLAGGDLSDVACVVDSAGWDADSHTGDVVLRLVERGHIIAPAARIASVSSTVDTDDTITLTADDAVGAAPARQFAVGWHLSCFDVSAAVTYSHTVAEVLDDFRLRLNDALGFAPAAGDWMTVGSYPDSVGDTAVNASVGVAPVAFAYLADSGDKLSTSDAPHRWTA